MDQQLIDNLKQYLATLKLPNNITPKEKRYIQRNSHNFVVRTNQLYKYNIEHQTLRKVLNQTQAVEVLFMCHQHPLGGHLGYHNTLYKISTKYYWITMAKDVQDYVKKCRRCQTTGPKKLNEFLYPVPVKSKPFEQWGIDVKHVPTSKSGYRYVIAAIDYLTKWVEARALKYQSTSEIALFVYEEIICRHGTPHLIISDNGTPFVSELIQRVCKHYNIHHNTITVGNSQANGLIERFNSTLGSVIKKITTTEKGIWDQYLPSVLFAYRTIKQNSTKQSPFYLTYGYIPKTPFDHIDTVIDFNSYNFENQLMLRTKKEIVALNLIRQQAAEKIKKSQENQKKAIDKKVNNRDREWKPAFRIGEIVTLYTGIQSNSWSGKISDIWQGRYIIHQSLGKGTYLIKSLDINNTRIKRVHGNRLKLLLMPDVYWNTHVSKTYGIDL